MPEDTRSVDATLPDTLSDPASPPSHVTLADGTTRDLSGLGRDELVRIPRPFAFPFVWPFVCPFVPPFAVTAIHAVGPRG